MSDHCAGSGRCNLDPTPTRNDDPSDSASAASNEHPMGPKVPIRVLLLVGTLPSSASTAQIIGQIEETKREGQCSIRRIVVSLFRIGPDRVSSNKKVTIPLSDGAVLRASFINPKQGWVNISGRVFATDDGGAKWVELKVGGPWLNLPSICVPLESFPPPKAS